jgi:hypothetical protein
MSRIPAAAVLLAALLASLQLDPTAAAAEPVPSVVTADGPVTWSVEPTPTSEGGRRAFTYETDPGTQIQDSFLITNAGDTEAEFIIYATDAFNDIETGNFSLLKAEEEPRDLGSWITPASERLTIGPGLQATVPFNLLIPSDATPGDHSAGIVASVLTETEQDGSTVLLEQRVGVRMYLTVSGAPVASVEVQALTSSFTPSLNPFAPGDLTVTYEVRNTGNKRVDVTQALHASGIFGIPLGTTTADPITDLLPRQIVRVNVQLSGIPALLYALSDIRLEPGAVGSATVVDDPAEEGSPTPAPSDAATSTPTPEATADAGGPIDPDQSEIDYAEVTAQTGTVAITWTLLALILLLLAALYLVWRYVTGTRERMYAAIDEAAAAARDEVLASRDEARTS